MQTKTLCSLPSRPQRIGLLVYTQSAIPLRYRCIFLCSDGVWEMLETKQLEAFLSLGGEEGSSEIADALFTAQCRDNISFIHLAP